MDTVYFDWSGGYLTAIANDDPATKIFRPQTTSALLDTLHEPTRLVSEATFESFDTDVRAAVIERARREGHEWFTTPNRQTGRHRRSLLVPQVQYDVIPPFIYEAAKPVQGGVPGDKKSDDLDVLVIRHLAQVVPECLKRPNVRSEDDPLLVNREAANYELMLLRRSNRLMPNNSAQGFKVVSAKEDYADSLIEHLPDFKSLSDLQKLALGGKSYSKPLVAAAGKATKYSRSRRDFIHFAGLFAHGYPCQIRSDFHFWTWKFVKKRGVSMSDFRRECLWLYHHLNEMRDIL